MKDTAGMDSHIIDQLLGSVTEIRKDHEQHANANGENFNIFSILKMRRKEVETHSRFIYELLNPNGSHKPDQYVPHS